MSKPKIKWIDAIDKAVKKHKRPVRLEWKRFCQEEKIELLKDLADPSCEDVPKFHNIYNICLQDKDFVKQCIIVSLENEILFLPFFEILENLIVFKNLVILKDQADSLKYIYDEALIALLDFENMEMFGEILNRLEKEKTNFFYTAIHQDLQKNSPILIAACRKDNLELVRIMVSYGCRLSSPHLDSKRTVESSFSIFYSQLPRIHSSKTKQKFCIDDEDDEVNDLLHLRMMAKPSYILACYEFVVDKDKSLMDDKKDKDSVCNFSYECNCLQEDTLKYSINSWQFNPTNGFHFCPANPNFNPSMNCKIHAECNDPIFRCFDLANIAKEYAKSVPECREEYEEISKQCHQLSVQLLEQCTSTGEVQILLKEGAGSSKYLRHANQMEYPRLRLAIEHNHKEFVSHMYCQQMLRQQWQGDTIWHGTPSTYKLLYFLFQIFLAPVFVMSYFVIDILKLFHINFDSPNDTNLDYQPSKLEWILKKTNAMKQNLDVPLNRYLIFTGYYIIFVVLLTTVNEDHKRVMDSHNETEYSMGHFFLTIYTVSMLWSDIQTIMSLKSIKTYFKFWRVFDLALHMCLFFAVTFKMTKNAFYSINSLEQCTNFNNTESNNTVSVFNDCLKILKECQNLCINRNFLGDMESVFLAIAATLSMLRLIYWLQSHEKVGPVVINIRRVILTISSILGTYIFFIFAFSFGLVFVIPNEDCFASSFKQILHVLFWSILDPGKNDEDLKIELNSIRGTVAELLFMIYQITIIFVLLNLLIAVMNATIQKVHDQKLLYWKFVRTSIWIQFFDNANAIPTPFSIINIPGRLFHGIALLIKVCRKMYKSYVRNDSRNLSMNEAKNPCFFNNDQIQARKNHVKLMMDLIQRYNGNFQIEKDDNETFKKSFKRHFVKHMKSVMRSKK